jgi:hypothetical protein
MKIVGLDPGKNHFAYSVIEAERCKKHGFVHTITTLEYKKLGDEVVRFMTDIEALLAEEPDVVVMERMQHRPSSGGGAVVEYINFMIGLVIGAAHQRHTEFFLVMPSVWKTHFARMYNLNTKVTPFSMATQKMVVKAPKESGKKTMTITVTGILDGQPKYPPKMTPHEGDAIGIGCYGWFMTTGTDIVKTVLA